MGISFRFFLDEPIHKIGRIGYILLMQYMVTNIGNFSKEVNFSNAKLASHVEKATKGHGGRSVRFD